ncbi:MAG: PrsW family intramembrane metalloprotease [Eubacterium sp.]|nr:PrsW family intramembrane metalloprotease [Eubacterium sp.]
MILLILAIIVSFIPAIALYRWLKNRIKEEEAYQSLCSSALKRGILSIFPILLVSAIFQIIIRLTGIKDTNPLLYQALYNFIVLAFAEELVKYLAFRRTLKKTDYMVSWLDVTILMTIVGIGFDLIESIVYAIGASVPVVLIRGICIPHAGYGFLVGYFYGKGVKNGKAGTKWIGFVLAWLMHGLYDFSLKEELVAVNDNLVVIPLALAVIDIVFVILLVRFVRKVKEKELYTEPLPAIRIA